METRRQDYKSMNHGGNKGHGPRGKRLLSKGCATFDSIWLLPRIWFVFCNVFFISQRCRPASASDPCEPVSLCATPLTLA